MASGRVGGDGDDEHVRVRGRERGEEGEEHDGEAERVPRVAWHAQGIRELAKRQEVARGKRSRVEHVPSPTGTRRKATGRRWWAGLSSWAARWVATGAVSWAR